MSTAPGAGPEPGPCRDGECQIRNNQAESMSNFTDRQLTRCKNTAKDHCNQQCRPLVVRRPARWQPGEPLAPKLPPQWGREEQPPRRLPGSPASVLSNSDPRQERGLLVKAAGKG